MHALLVYPRFPITYWGFQYGLRLIGKQASLPPLGLITVAALLPSHWRIRLVDLNLEELSEADLDWADVVLTGGLLIQVDSMRQIIARARSWRKPVAVGGPAPTTSPQLFGDADVVFRGEAEGRIEALVEALARGADQAVILDAPTTFPDMTSVPVPRFDLLDLSAYASLSVQYSRGCPFQCEFCDIIEIFGRRSRVKGPGQVIAELSAIHRLGYEGTIFFVDDNFIGNKVAVRQLLPLIRDWQRSRGQPFEFYTEASVDLAADPQILQDMVQAGFSSVFLGIETPSREALKQAGKLQNLRLDPTEAIDRITRAGIEVMGGFIVGFDSDEPDIFAQQLEFLQSQPIPLAMVGILTALPGTALWRRLKAEGRLRRSSNGDPFSRPNFVPIMNEQALLQGYGEFLTWLYSPREYYRRCRAHLDRVGPGPSKQRFALSDLSALLRTIWHVGVLSPRRRLFWKLLTGAMRKGRRQVRQAIVHAVQGEHLISYTRDHVVPRMASALAEVRSEAGRRPPALPTAEKEAPLSSKTWVEAAAHAVRSSAAPAPISNPLFSVPKKECG